MGIQEAARISPLHNGVKTEALRCDSRPMKTTGGYLGIGERREVKTPEQIQEAMIQLRQLMADNEKTYKGTLAERILKERFTALFWVMKAEPGSEVIPPKKALDIASCLW